MRPSAWASIPLPSPAPSTATSTNSSIIKVSADLSVRVFSQNRRAALPGGGGGVADAPPGLYAHLGIHRHAASSINATRIGEYSSHRPLDLRQRRRAASSASTAPTWGPSCFGAPDFAPIRLGYLTNSPWLLQAGRRAGLAGIQGDGAPSISAICWKLDVRSGGDVFKSQSSRSSARWIISRAGIRKKTARSSSAIWNISSSRRRIELAHRVIMPAPSPILTTALSQRGLIDRGAAGVLAWKSPVSRINREQSRPGAARPLRTCFPSASSPRRWRR